VATPPLVTIGGSTFARQERVSSSGSFIGFKVAPVDGDVEWDGGLTPGFRTGWVWDFATVLASKSTWLRYPRAEWRRVVVECSRFSGTSLGRARRRWAGRAG
jgi:hypothetical protein